MRGPAILLPALVASFIAACSLFGGDDDTLARISNGGVDGIRFGDSIEDVIDKIGQPWNVGWVHGRWRSWYHLTYGTYETHDTLMLYFSIPSGGPDSLSVVDAIVVRNTYSGRTQAGIGIGSTAEEIARAYGEPSDERERTDRTMWYCIEGMQTELNLEADTLTALLVGFETPIDDFPAICQ